jgi:tetratricopeptide (TPR) repeat protein
MSRDRRSVRVSLVLAGVSLLWAFSPHTQALAQKKRKAAASDSGSPVMERALKLYEGEDYYSASIELFKVVEGESGDTESNKQRAEFVMGKALYKLKFYSASLSYFDKVVSKGAAHPHYNETLKWLASLSREVSDSAGVLDKIGKYNKAELDQPALATVRDELYFLLGKYNYNKGKFKEAVALFSSVNPKSEFFVQAKLFEGATYVREYQAKPAREAFVEVLRVATDNSDPKIKPYEDLANLSLARVFYSVGQFKEAAKYYDKVSMESYDWPNSLFESSWANFNLKQEGYSKALGNIHTLQAPFFENFIKPESIAEALTVKATIYFYNCLYDKAYDVIRDFNERVPPLAQELKRVVDQHSANDAFYDYAVKIREGNSGLPSETERAAKAVLSDRSLGRRFEYVKELDRELAQHERADPAWKSTAVANAVLTDVTLQRSLTVNETGELARQRVSRLVGELAQLIKRVIKIEYEILQGQKGQLEQEVIQEQQLSTNARATEIGNVRVDDEHQYWPFTGEYWRDELGYYRYRLLNRCEKMAPEGAPTGPTGP